MVWKRLITGASLWGALAIGCICGFALAVASDPQPAFSYNRASLISWRGGGDSTPAGVETSGWSAPMFYTTPAEGGPPNGRRATGVWAPGDTVERSLIVKNIDCDSTLTLQQFQVALTGPLDLVPWLRLTVRGPSGETLYQGPFPNGAPQTLSTSLILPRGTQKTLTFAVAFDRTAGNPLQNRTLKADFTLIASEYILPMVIDVHPSSWPNPINPGQRGNIPVAINGSPNFDVRRLDWETARFGPNQIPPIRRAAFDDWNHDGNTDMILHFDNRIAGFTCGMTSATLTIESQDGQEYQGADAIVTPPCR